MIRILFVCTGNICRSPGAEALLRFTAESQGRSHDFHIDSAGTHGYHVGEAPDARAIAVAKERDVLMRGLRARQVTRADFEEFDYIIALDQGHYRILAGRQPRDGRAKLKLFTDYCAEHKGKDVPDPYYGTEEDFDRMFDLLEKGVEGILKQFEEEG